MLLCCIHSGNYPKVGCGAVNDPGFMWVNKYEHIKSKRLFCQENLTASQDIKRMKLDAERNSPAYCSCAKP